MNVVDKLFEDEEKIHDSIQIISEGLLNLSSYTIASILDLVEAEILGKKIRRSCDDINDLVHKARKQLGILMTETTSVIFKNSEQQLHSMENTLALIHGDVEIIGKLAEGFFKAPNREATFDNLNKHYSELVNNVVSLMTEENEIKVSLD